MQPTVTFFPDSNDETGMISQFSRMGDLPVFTRQFGRYVHYYSPGFLAVVERSNKDSFDRVLLSEEPQGQVSRSLLEHAHAASNYQHPLSNKEYKPTCLTLYMGNRCNLACRYCYSFPALEDHTIETISTTTLHQAAMIVAENSRTLGKPLTVVFHGGGEPTLYRKQIDRFLDEVSTIAHTLGLETFYYIATNGAISTIVADWLSRRFDLVGLSCDGPADIQDRQRPTNKGQATSFQVERTARILSASGLPFHVRVTITPEIITRQCEIIKYICEVLNPIEIHLEPVYAGGRTGKLDVISHQQASLFVSNFLSARNIARQYGVPVQFSDLRPWELHGRYCQTEREVLQLIPGAGVSTCFKANNVVQAEQMGFLIGKFNNGELHMCEQPGLDRLRHKLNELPHGCLDCFANSHCTFGCPDICPINNDNEPKDSFRCVVNQLILLDGLQTLSDAMIQNTVPVIRENQAIGSILLKDIFL